MANPQKRIQAIAELFESEAAYIADLRLWHIGLQQHIATIPSISPKRRQEICQAIFINMDKIYDLHCAIFAEMERVNEAVGGKPAAEARSDPPSEGQAEAHNEDGTLRDTVKGDAPEIADKNRIVNSQNGSQQNGNNTQAEESQHAPTQQNAPNRTHSPESAASIPFSPTSPILFPLPKAPSPANDSLEYASIFLKYAPLFNIYKRYAAFLPRAEHELEQLMSANSDLASAVDSFLTKYNLLHLGTRNFLYRPSGKLTRYPLLLRAIAKHEPNEEFKARYQTLITTIDGTTAEVDRVFKARAALFNMFNLLRRLKFQFGASGHSAMGLCLKSTRLLKEGRVLVQRTVGGEAAYKRILIFNRFLLFAENQESHDGRLRINESPVYLTSLGVLRKEFALMPRDPAMQALFPIFLVATDTLYKRVLYFEDQSTRDLFFIMLSRAVHAARRHFCPAIQLARLHELRGAAEQAPATAGAVPAQPPRIRSIAGGYAPDPPLIVTRTTLSLPLGNEEPPKYDSDPTHPRIPRHTFDADSELISHSASDSSFSSDSWKDIIDQDRARNEFLFSQNFEAPASDSSEREEMSNEDLLTSADWRSWSGGWAGAIVGCGYNERDATGLDIIVEMGDSMPPEDPGETVRIENASEALNTHALESPVSGIDGEGEATAVGRVISSGDARTARVAQNPVFDRINSPDSARPSNPKNTAHTACTNLPSQHESTDSSVLEAARGPPPPTPPPAFFIFSSKDGIFKSTFTSPAPPPLRLSNFPARHIIYDAARQLLFFLVGHSFFVSPLAPDSTALTPQPIPIRTHSFFYEQSEDTVYLTLIERNEFSFSVLYLFTITRLSPYGAASAASATSATPAPNASLAALHQPQPGHSHYRAHCNGYLISMHKRMYIGFNVSSLAFMEGKMVMAARTFDIIRISTLMTQELLDMYDPITSALRSMIANIKARAVFRIEPNTILLCYDCAGFYVDSEGRFKLTRRVFFWERQMREFRLWGGRRVVGIGRDGLVVCSLESGRIQAALRRRGLRFVGGAGSEVLVADRAAVYRLTDGAGTAWAAPENAVVGESHSVPWLDACLREDGVLAGAELAGDELAGAAGGSDSSVRQSAQGDSRSSHLQGASGGAGGGEGRTDGADGADGAGAVVWIVNDGKALRGLCAGGRVAAVARESRLARRVASKQVTGCIEQLRKQRQSWLRKHRRRVAGTAVEDVPALPVIRNLRDAEETTRGVYTSRAELLDAADCTDAPLSDAEDSACLSSVSIDDIIDEYSK